VAAGMRRRRQRPGPEPTVLHVLEANCGGTARHVVDLVEWTHGVRHVVAVPRSRRGFFTEQQAVERMRAAGADVRVISMRRLPFHPVNAVAVARLAALRHEVGADVVHGHSAIGGALARLLPGRAARVYTPNGLHPSPAAMSVERRLARRSDRLIAVSESEGALMADAGLGADRVTVIPNGVDPDLLPPAIDLHSVLGLDRSTPLVGTIARLDPQKDPEHTMRVFAKVAVAAPDVHFVLIGDGVKAEQVDALGGSGALAGRFHRIAGLPGAAGALPSLQVFTLLSRYEGGPYAPLEAARAGVPLVLTDAVGNRDVVVPGVSGELVALDDEGAAVAAILRLLDDGARRGRMVHAMRRRLAAVFSLAHNGRAHADLYRELAGTSRTLDPAPDPYPESTPAPMVVNR
jgi:glycosyltransferase involved in cell wall biosynthesis